MKRLITPVVFIACAVVVSSSLYDYNSTDQERGPAHWFTLTEIANNTCGGERQSPIDIETRLAGTSGCDIYGDYQFLVSSARTKERGNVLQPVTHNCHFKKSKLIWPPNAQKGDCTFGDAEFEVSDHNVEVSFSNARLHPSSFTILFPPMNPFIATKEASLRPLARRLFTGAWPVDRLRFRPRKKGIWRS